MDVIHRIKFHARMKIQSIKNWWEEAVLHKTDEEIFAEFNALADSIPQEEKDEIERTVKEHYEETDANRPVLNPRRTMLIHSRPEEHGCNSLTAASYRQKILNAIEWAQERGVTTFMADYYTPLGLLALETLVELREEGADFRVYAVRSCYFGQRRTYRMVPETGVEMAFLPARADYSYHDSLEEMFREVLPNAWMHCSERGIWMAKDKIPAYLLEAWEI